MTQLRRIDPPMARMRRYLTTYAPLGALNRTVSTRGLSIHRNIRYGPESCHRLDLYAPKHLNRSAPVVVFFYGGKWRHGSRRDYLFAAQGIAAGGAVCILADYGLYPEVVYPAFLDNAARACAWAAANSHHYGGDPNTLFIAGHSSGAYIAAMLALKPEYLQTHDMDPAQLRGLVGLCGPYDFLPIVDPQVLEVFGPMAHSRETQPIDFVRADAPPALLITGGQDTTVRPGNTVRFARALEQAGAEVDCHIYQHLTHAGVVLTLAAPFRWRAPVLEQLLGFVRQHGGHHHAGRGRPPPDRKHTSGGAA